MFLNRYLVCYKKKLHLYTLERPMDMVEAGLTPH